LSLPIEIVPLTLEHASYWDTKVQPIIDKKYRLSNDNNRGALPIRADVGWNWKRWIYLSWLQSVFQPKNRAVGYALVAQAPSQKMVPIGLLLCVPGFECKVDEAVDNRNLIWFLSDAPREVFSQMVPCQPPPVKLAQVLLDTAIIGAAGLRNTKETILHADVGGGEKLIMFYETICGMVRLPLDNGSISKMRTKDVDRYFYFNEVSAKRYSGRFDELR
jgi:hypothetical protein